MHSLILTPIHYPIPLPIPLNQFPSHHCIHSSPSLVGIVYLHPHSDLLNPPIGIVYPPSPCASGPSFPIYVALFWGISNHVCLLLGPPPGR